jgi:hypothetical protein
MIGDPDLSVGSPNDLQQEPTLADVLALADDAIALLNEWDKNMWENDKLGKRVMDADLADLYRRRRAMGEVS